MACFAASRLAVGAGGVDAQAASMSIPMSAPAISKRTSWRAGDLGFILILDL
jgi:hypothetical protein